MSGTSRVPAAIDALVALFQATPGLGVAGVAVVDGPIITGDPLHEAVFVGYDGDPDGDGEAVTFDQEWAGLGARAKNESFVVMCAVSVWSGSTKVVPVRTRAFEMLGEVETALRTDPSLGLPPPTVVAMASGSLVQSQRGSGLECRIPFQIAVQTRI
ncbi:hypothetical protein AB0B89_27185 [Sphaerisporangium sp. NPDC049002]|uniref:hypothetical protein n=1 Tax=Sphaerisporangium sp. NPDC049002 TaxID=3155392 RepID=UPI003404C8F6